MLKLLGRNLYERGLAEAQKDIVDEAQPKFRINSPQMDDPAKTALDIFQLVSVDPTIQMDTKLIFSYKKGTRCRLEKNETLSNSIYGFCGLPAKHLLYSDASKTSTIAEFLATTLRNNAALDEITLTNSKLQLNSLAEARAKGQSNDVEMISIPSKKLNALMRSMAKFFALFTAVPEGPDPNLLIIWTFWFTQ